MREMTRPRELLRGPATREGDGVRTRNHRIDNPVTSPKKPNETAILPEERNTGATNAPDLDAVVKAWPTLPAALKAGILAMVKAASLEGKA
jgi:hypothetical protein